MDPALVEQLIKQLQGAEQGHSTSLIVTSALLTLLLVDKVFFWWRRSHGERFGDQSTGGLVDLRNRVVDVDRHVKDVSEGEKDIARGVGRLISEVEAIDDEIAKYNRETREAMSNANNSLDRIEKRLGGRK